LKSSSCSANLGSRHNPVDDVVDVPLICLVLCET
jgi:hypothetical protein